MRPAPIETDARAVLRMRDDMSLVIREARALQRILRHADARLFLDVRDFDDIVERVRSVPADVEGST